MEEGCRFNDKNREAAVFICTGPHAAKAASRGNTLPYSICCRSHPTYLRVEMWGIYGIISTEIIPAPVRVRPEGGQTPKRTVRIPRRGRYPKDILIISTEIIPAPVRVRPEGGQTLKRTVRIPRRGRYPKDM